MQKRFVNKINLKMNQLWIVLIAGLFSILATCQSQAAYSQQNMPRTSFTCRDKILGGYYADPETNCQMFHICVKIAGVGIQDFRFLCPNHTAFDEEAQICADWGDVDCGSTTRYYGNDNFDLYRIGTNFESKRNSYAEEDESVFHLQHAETSDARRSKQYIVNQNSIQTPSRPVSTTTYRPPTTTATTTTSTTPRTTSSTTRVFYETTTHIRASTYKPTIRPKKIVEDKVIVSTYRPSNDYFSRSKAAPVQDDGEIFKQSQSSHFYNNKNNGKEDFEDEYVKASNTKAPIAKQKVRGRHRGRSKYRNPNAVTSAPTKTPTTHKAVAEQSRASFTNTPIVVQPVVVNQRPNVTTLQAATSYQAQQSRQFISPSSTAAPSLPQSTDESFVDVPKIQKKVQSTKLKSASAPTKVVPLTSSSTFAPPAQPQIPFNPFFGAIPQRVIIPSQLSAEQRLALQASNGKSLTTASTIQTTSSTTPVTPQQINRVNQVSEQLKNQQKFNFKSQKYEFVEPQNPTTQFYNTKYETNGQLNLEPTKSNLVKQNTKIYASRQTTTGQDESKPTTFNPQQYYQSNEYQNLSPRGFSLAAQQQAVKQTKAPEIRPQITSRSESRNHHKKFSTLVPKDQYNLPTTFKPSTYSKSQELKVEKIQNPSKYYTQIVTTSSSAPIIQTTTQIPRHVDIQTTTRHPGHFSTSITPRPLDAGEEDDGQYRPELYEKDLYKNKAKTTKTSTFKPVQNALFSYYQTSSTAVPQQQQNFEEDELFKTAHSQNIFASGNALRAEKEKEKVVKNFEQYTEKSSPRPFSKPTLAPSTTKVPKKSQNLKRKEEKDVSYDYQYYDTNDQSDYPEIAPIEDFGRTVKKSSTN